MDSTHFDNNLVDQQNQTNTANTISELAAATADDRTTMINLTATVQILTAQLATTQGYLVATLAANTNAGHNV